MDALIAVDIFHVKYNTEKIHGIYFKLKWQLYIRIKPYVMDDFGGYLSHSIRVGT